MPNTLLINPFVTGLYSNFSLIADFEYILCKILLYIVNFALYTIKYFKVNSCRIYQLLNKKIIFANATKFISKSNKNKYLQIVINELNL